MTSEFKHQAKNLNSSDPSDFLLESEIEKIWLFIDEILKVNKSINLTKWVHREDIKIFHILDSLQILPIINDLKISKQKWIDVGTGSGFPGVVLAVAFPDWEITFLDSVGKKIIALDDCLKRAGIEGKLINMRAEILGQDLQSREMWDGVISRAVADFPVILEYTIPLLKVGGYFVNWMTEKQLKIVEKSQKALNTLNAQVIGTRDYFLPGVDKKRSLVIVKKNGKTPNEYPRKIGKPSKNPLT